MKELSKIYDPKQVEDRTYQFWLDGGYFHAEPNPDKKPYTIVIPPPNITGQLHMGHALDETLQDILIRFRRMQGYEALWLPGTDHASIATEAKIVNAMKEEGLTKEDLGREGFLERAWEWKRKYGGRIIEQLKKLGSSCDWDRERFTLDEGCSKAVKEVFVNLYNKGLIYQGERIINWCPHCMTSISDAEVEYEEQAGHFWHLRYPLSDGSGEVILATTRPETMLGDTAVAVNPKDERYQNLIGKTVILPLVGREIPIVGDDYVDMEFGTGVVKITPAHDPNDYEVGRRHNLPIIKVMNDDATMTETCGKYAGMDRYEARKAIVKDLEEQGYLIKIEEHTHNVGTCYRCGTTVEPMVSKQWFVKMEPLAKPAIDVVRNGEIKLIPERMNKTYYNWMENIKDWCISRQLWWGHRIPAWYCADCGHVTVSKEDATECEACRSKNIEQDPDVLDTWFSSALWPFSTLGWPEETEDLKYFYPTDVLVTGYDIIFFWVARMIFSACEQMHKIPFHTVLIHGLIRDPQGKKMSKSAGNGVDPIEMIERFGADALRFNIITGNSPGNDMRFYVERCEAMRNFANKLWNASRFVMMNLTIGDCALPEKLELEDRWILSKLNSLRGEVRENLDRYELGIAAQKIYDFIWDSYCDWYIELTKPRLNGGDAAAKEGAERVLLYVLTDILKLLHPFMPYITEEIFQAIPHEGEALIVAPYPKYDAALSFPEDEAGFELIMDAVKAVRSRRAEMNVPPSKRPTLIITSDRPEVFEAGRTYLSKLAYAGEVEISAEAPADTEGMVSVVTGSAKMFMPMAELVDIEKERARLEKELEKARAQLEAQNKKLANESFVSRAPEAVVNAERERAEKAKALIANLEESLAKLK